MVGGSRPLVRGRRFRVPLLAVLTIRQQAAPRFRSLNPIACRVPIAPAPVAIPRVKLAHRAKAGPGPRPILSFKGWGFRCPRLRPGPCGACPPSYMRLTVAISRAFDCLGVWIGAPSGPGQPAAKRRVKDHGKGHWD